MHRIAILLALIALGAALFFCGIGWGLPTRDSDRFLFGTHPVWSGDDILALAASPEENDARAADVSSRPLDRSHGAAIANADDRDRARIVRRYRLMSYQPDEFATFAALAQFKPARARFDPRMYKYGGLWVYPVGAMLKVAGLLRLVTLTANSAYYLDHPEQFGRFYVIARCYSAAWGLAGIVAIFFIIRRCCGSTPAASFGALCFMLMPVVLTAAHEAKPHLAGTVLILFAILSAATFVERGRRRYALGAAILGGAAAGMVPSACLMLLILPGMIAMRRALLDRALRPGRMIRATLGLASISAILFCITNPYVPINLLRDRAVLRSDFGNSAAFYHPAGPGEGFLNAALLIGFGASFLLAIAGAAGGVALGWRAVRTRCATPDEVRRRATGMLLAAAALPVAVVFFAFAGNQPADYARFALPFDVFLLVEAIVAVATFVGTARSRAICFLLLTVATGLAGSFYLRGFLQDAGSQTTRFKLASRLDEERGSGKAPVLASRQEPAPWSLPPVNLFQWQVIVAPRGWPADRPFPGADVTVGPENLPAVSDPIRFLTATPISWAAKSFELRASGKPANVSNLAADP